MQGYHRFFLLLLYTFAPLFVVAQKERVLIHAHNDYRQQVPFYHAYSQQVYSIEADVFATEEGAILVGHDWNELDPSRNLETLYIKPIVETFASNGGKAWAASNDRFVLLIDLKTPAATTLQQVVELVAEYPNVFDETVNPYAVSIVISGDMPAPEDFAAFPHYISFDGRFGINYTADQLKRIAFISAPFSSYAKWNGKGQMAVEDEKRVADAIGKAHDVGKKVRFWGTPDGVTAWNTLNAMGVDIINTDQVKHCTEFFRRKPLR